MRHTRNRQLEKLGIDCEDLNNIRMDDKRNPNMFWFSWHHQDPTFKWHRDFEGWGENWVEFGGDEYSYGELICVKGNNLHLEKGWSRTKQEAVS
jgi:hypothetical protein